MLSRSLRPPGKGCGIQMWKGKAEGEGEAGLGPGEVCSQLALILCDDVEIVGKHESAGWGRVCRSGPGINST